MYTISGDEDYGFKHERLSRMAARIDIPAIPQFDAESDASSLGTRWEARLARFDIYVAAAAITDKTQKRALLLHLAGESVQKVFKGLKDTGDDCASAVKALNAYFLPKKNVRYERYVFKQIVQEPGESIDQFVARLRTLSQTCEFADADDAIADQVVEKCLSTRLKRRVLRDNTTTLEKILEEGRALEQTEAQVQRMKTTDDAATPSVNAVFRRKGRSNQTYQSNQQGKSQNQNNNSKAKCYHCGGPYPHDRACPAKGKTCGNCGKLDHFSSVCLQGKAKNNGRNTDKQGWGKKTVNKVDAEQGTAPNDGLSSTDDEWVLSVHEDHHVNALHGKQPRVTVSVAGVDIPVLMDTGASVNLIDQPSYEAVCKHQEISLTPDSTRVYVYGATTPLPIAGQFDATVATPDRSTTATFHLTRGKGGCLLGYSTAVELGLINVPKLVNAVDTHSTPPSFTKDFADVFKGTGKLKGYQFRIHIDPTVKPVAQPPRRVPFHVRQQVEEQLEQLESAGIIEPVEGPTPWVSPIVIVPKGKDKIRVCVDMRMPNTAVMRERHPTPTMDEIIHDLTGATVFSKLDLHQAYHQVELDPESRYLTTFVTHKGLRRYTRLMFGLSSASEIFQEIIQQILAGIPGARNISDDIVVFGKDQASHDQALQQVFERLRARGLTLNQAKCVFSAPKVVFHGHTFTGAGVSPDAHKVETICNMAPPTNAGELRSLLGLTNYVSRFIPNYATITAPLRELTRQNVEWQWSDKQDTALEALKTSLSKDPVVAYYDPDKPIWITTDASPVGVGAVLTQGNDTGKQQVVAYASRALTDTESRYSQTEREALGIVWACERLHLYVYGAPFTVVTDHKPLLPLFNSPRSKLPVRIERWMLRLQPYNMTVVYRPGATNPADYLSRHPLTPANESNRNVTEDYVHYVKDNAIPMALTEAEIKDAANQDDTIQHLKQVIQSGRNWDKNDPVLKPYYKIQQELTVADDLILRGHRLLVPEKLRPRILQLAHEGHQGVVKTKKLLRQKVWYPGIDKDVEELVTGCIPCQATGLAPPPEPLQMSQMPEQPWSEVSADFYGPVPTGEYILVLVDGHSRYPEVDIVKSTSAVAVIPKIDRMLSTHGVPHIIKTDNGPPFNGSEFKKYSKEKGFIHRKITPYWPKANAEAERFMRTMGKAIRTAHAEGKNWRPALNQFLLNYRATAHVTTGVSPAELLFGRPIRTKLPEPAAAAQNSTARKRDAGAKDKMKAYADRKTGARSSPVKEGDTVLLKQKKENKFSTNFGIKPYRVEQRQGSMVIVKGADGRRTARNVTHVKKVPPFRQGQNMNDEDADIGDDLDQQPDVVQPQLQQEAVPQPLRHNPPRARRPPARFRDE